MVTKRIKDVIAKIRLTHPELARHLATCIRTGYTCTYVADDDHPQPANLSRSIFDHIDLELALR